LGEGGAIAPPATIANAVNDALKELGVELLVSPITPDIIVAAIRSAGRARDKASEGH
jgi:aerobic carbon-monoxide dehydrogenase large subunit